jgi:hypothetical protein
MISSRLLESPENTMRLKKTFGVPRKLEEAVGFPRRFVEE